MKALITGASSGIGKDMAKYMDKLGYDLILVARDKTKLEDVEKKCEHNVKTYCYDLSVTNNCYKLINNIKDDEIDVVINNAGFGVFGDYLQNNLDRELNMIDLNIKCLHILTKYALNNKSTRYILNVASAAGLIRGGPLMSAYYGSKSYVCNYSFAIHEELRRNKSNKHISILCPGPVDTNFNKIAGVNFNLKSLTSEYVAKYAIDKMFKNYLLIVPGFVTRIGLFFTRFISTKLLLKITYKIQKKKA